MDKIFFEHSDYLPNGWTFEKLQAAVEKKLSKKAIPFTKESLAEIINPEFLNMTEDELIEYLAAHMENTLPTHALGSQPRFAYAEDLDKDDELNQDFPEATEDK
ncbi:MAG: hypothetical protein J6X03_00115 [Bacilli bacterium]|nr:hypothetical protein [Bacilli bacterium]